ncbi:MAG: histidinol dehydrogenase [Thermodesulfovibrionales bacterium]
MRMIRTEAELARFLGILKVRAAAADPQVVSAVSGIIAGIRKNGNRSLRNYTRRFDRHNASSLRISVAEIRRYAAMASPSVVAALKAAAVRIRRFHRMQAEKSWMFREKEALLGQVIRPLARVGVYVPGGKAAYPSTVLMNVIPAQIAGVREIAVCVPTPGNEINPSVMAALLILGVEEVYRIGGAQAVAAMAFGTETIRPVDKIVGPGNIFVATAKRMVFGTVDIDMIAGPSEILVIADRTAEPAFAAADILGQAEHDELASSVLITDSARFAQETEREIAEQLRRLKRKATAAASLKKYGAVILVKDLRDAARISNLIAPEHLELMTAQPDKLLPLIEHAGAIFLGHWTPEALGDYAAGPNHTLPTGGTARFSSPLGVYDFCKRSSLVGFTQKGFGKLARVVETVADAEGLEAHAHSVRVRRKAAGNRTRKGRTTQ